MKKLAHAEDIGGRVRYDWVHTGDYGETLYTSETVQDVEPLIRQNAEKYNSASKSYGTQETFHEVAEFPDNVVEEFCKIHQIPWGVFMVGKSDYAKHLWNILMNDPMFRAFRTKPTVVTFK